MKRNLLIVFFVTFLSATLFSQNNFDFELTPPGVYTTSNAVSGWTISSATATNNCSPSGTWSPGSSEFAILATPIVTHTMIGFINHSPFGGTNVAQLNNSQANSSSTKLARTITVTPSYNSFQFAFAAFLENGHNCCDQPSFHFIVKDQQNITLSCNSFTIIPAGSSCLTMINGFNISPNGTNWSNWQTRVVDLSPYTGSVVTIELIMSDCTFGDHYSTAYFDTKLTNGYINLPPNVAIISAPNPINYCPSSGPASINAPLGYTSYLWSTQPFNPPTNTSTVLYITQPGSVHTVSLVNSNGCQSTISYTLIPSVLEIIAIGSGSSCTQSPTGSATVVAWGGGPSYSYSWINSANVVVGTSSIVSGLASGNYTVNVSAGFNSSCGTASAAITIGIKPKTLTDVYKPFCGNQAYLNTAGGSNFQWYAGTVAIPANQGGTAPSYTINTPSNGSIYFLSYLSSQGCEDSIRFTLNSSLPGTITTLPNSLVCADGTNKSTTFQIEPTVGSLPASYTYSIFSIGSTPTFSTLLNSGLVSTYNASVIPAGNYSVDVFDGSCKYSTNFSVTPYIFSYSITPDSHTICPGTMVHASVTFTSPPLFSQYTYSWSPGTNIIGSTVPNVIISATAAPSNPVTTIYTVIVTPTLVNCPLTKTISITAFHPITPTISPMPSFCYMDPTYTITVNPPAGQFIPISGLSPGGIITPQYGALGLNSFTFVPSSQSTCTLSPITGTFIVNSSPSFFPTGPLSICAGQSSTLSLPQANLTYSWSTGSTSSSVVLSPSVTTTYTLSQLAPASSCSSNIAITLTVVPVPTLNLTGVNTLCSGESTTLSVSGANIYIWSNGSLNSSIIISPASNIIYTVTGLNSYSCQSTSLTHAVNVLQSPTLSVLGNTIICKGETINLLASGADTYSWSAGALSPGLTSSPLSDTIYVVRGISTSNLCSSSEFISVKVLECTNISKYKSADVINIYPNPVSEELFIENAHAIKLILTDSFGKIISEQNLPSGNRSLNLKGYASGVYFLTISNEKTFEVIKFIKID